MIAWRKRAGHLAAIGACAWVMAWGVGAWAQDRGQAKATPAATTGEEAPSGFVKVACGEAPEGMACVEGGAFLRGSDTRDENARPQMTIWLSTFYIDTHEVTHGAYQACVKAGKCDEAGPRYRGYDGDDQPMTGASWFDAVKYCESKGMRLPTEAEWEKAARGTSGELYPWGDEPVTCARAIIEDERGRSCGEKKPGSKPEAGRVFDVGSRPVGRYGLYDMIGNVEEWVSDWYTPSFEACGEACQGLDPKGPCAGDRKCKGHTKRVLKGGSWYWPASHATGIHRRANAPSNRPYHHFGFRCAASVEQVKVLKEKGK